MNYPYRVFIEKKEEFRSEANSLKKEINESLSLNLKNIRIINVYDLFNISLDEFKIAEKIFSEIVADDVYYDIEEFETEPFFAMEFLEGQYDQRADWAFQSLLLLTGNEEAVVKSSKIILAEDALEEELEKIKKLVINEVESREMNIYKMPSNFKSPPVKEALTYEFFNTYTENELEDLLQRENMAMSIEDLKYIQAYFKGEEKRNPTETELKVLDTYWSDHCRHTTFETILEKITFEEGNLKESLEEAFNEFLEMRKKIGRDKPITLMELATINARYEKALGNLGSVEVSEEINACSININIDVDGVTTPYLLMFKNETHNHPTEIEPFGGASTCIGGCIRDPLSGRAFVYQAMRISGAGDILEPIEDTIEGKLPQRVISKTSAHGSSSYGNQIGVATTFVRELHHEGFKAKHMEVGAVVASAPLENVFRGVPEPGDLIIVIGGDTGRDGIGGATGSSKSHNISSSTEASSEVQKGNAPTERKIQRLFRNKLATKLIKRCNDFGAGGVCVAIGELADGVVINLNAMPLKYEGLSGTEIAISESQERMAVVISPSDLDYFLQLCEEENLNAVVVASVTEEKRLLMNYDGESIVNISRNFLNTNGVKSFMNVIARSDDTKDLFKNNCSDFLENLTKPNIASKQGMIEMFDSTVGAGTVLMPFGGKYQLTESEGSVHKISTLNGETNTASILTYGYNPDISSKSPFHGAAFAVLESIARVVSLGGKWQGIHFSFQEYFRKLGKDETLWGEPLKSLLGASLVLKEFGLSAIGGKDSMSGSFEDIHVPPTLISFAVQTEKCDNIISSEFKKLGSYVYLIKHNPLENLMPNVNELKENFDFVYKNISNKNIISAFSVKHGGIAEALFKMSFGNKIGVDAYTNENLFDTHLGSIVVESTEELIFENAHLLGKTGDVIKINGEEFSIEEAINKWESTFKSIFPRKTDYSDEKVEKITYKVNFINEINESNKIKKLNPNIKPRVLIPAFPGTNSEYDSARAFKIAGGNPEILVFKNLTTNHIKESIKKLADEIKKSQILMLPGGFSAGDEPDGSAKFITAILNNEYVKESVNDLLNRDGLILGICNGFQALVKSGLLPFAELTLNSPTLTYNNISRHQSMIVRTRFTGASSPWFNGISAGDIHNVVISHGEGRFMAKEETLKKLVEDSLIAFQYVDLEGSPTLDEIYNPNKSSLAVEGIISPCGKILGKMGHSERSGKGIIKNIEGDYDQKIFKSGVEYFK